MHLFNLARAAASDSARLAQNTLPLCQMIEKSVKVVHHFARELRLAILDDLGRIPVLEAHLADFPKQRGRHITFTAEEGSNALDPLCRAALLRVTAKALKSAHQHPPRPRPPRRFPSPSRS